MRIGDLGKIVDVPVATIRYYEQEGLIEKPARSDANYRHYGSEAVTRLEFIRRCRALGISLTEIRRLLRLTEAPDANCGEVDILLGEHIRNVREQRRDLAKLERELKALRAACHLPGKVRGCGILRDSALVVQGKGREIKNRRVRSGHNFRRREDTRRCSVWAACAAAKDCCACIGGVDCATSVTSPLTEGIQ